MFCRRVLESQRKSRAARALTAPARAGAEIPELINDGSQRGLPSCDHQKLGQHVVWDALVGILQTLLAVHYRGSANDLRAGGAGCARTPVQTVSHLSADDATA